MTRNRMTRLVLIGAILILLIAFSRLVGLYVDWLLFVETGYQFVFSRVITVQFLSGLCCGVFAFLFMFANMRLTNRIQFPAASISVNGYATIPINTLHLTRLSRIMGLLISIFVAPLTFQISVADSPSLIGDGVASKLITYI